MSLLRRSSRNKRAPELYVPVLRKAPIPQVKYEFLDKKNKSGGAKILVAKIETILQFNTGLCGAIDTHYVLNTGVTASDYLVVAKHGQQYIGFSLLQLRDSDSVYIDVICTQQGYGALLVHEIIRWTAQIGRRHVELSALPNVINFYRKIGFRLSDNKECKETDKLKKIANRVSGLRFNNPQEANSDRRFQALLDTLIQEELVANKNCVNIVQCSEHGYHMIYCIF